MNRVKKQIGLTQSMVEECGTDPVHIAILDSGIAMHPDLTNCLEQFIDLRNKRKEPYDDCGHGTHVAGCIAGDGMLSYGRYSGICTDSRLTAIKILDKDGDGELRHLMQGLYWVLEHRVEYRIRILNISVAMNKQKQKRGMEEARVLLENLWKEGVLVICAAGNFGPAEGSVSQLATGSQVITVGCHDGDLQRGQKKLCQNFSGRGSFLAPELKPDLVAPGTNIISCNAAYNIRRNGKIGKAYIAKSGTSMSTPIITGIAALLLKKYPYLTNEQVKEKLLTSTKTVVNDPYLQGHGMIDATKLFV